MTGNVRETAAQALLGLAIAGGITALFNRPFGFAPAAFLVALIGAAISGKHRRFGLATTFFVVLCFLIGASIAVWDSRSLY